MDERTEELRDIFLAVSGEESVTEAQTETRGSLTADEERVGERLRTLVETLRERESFDTDLATESYVEVVRAFYDDADDADIAERLDVDVVTAVRARLDLHLVRETDIDAPFEWDTLRARRNEADETLAADLGVDGERVAHYRRVLAAEAAARSANDRYRAEFEELLADGDVSGRYSERIREDGLREAAADIETDVSF